jgi:hypothetical protein
MSYCELRQAIHDITRKHTKEHFRVSSCDFVDRTHIFKVCHLQSDRVDSDSISGEFFVFVCGLVPRRSIGN